MIGKTIKVVETITPHTQSPYFVRRWWTCILAALSRLLKKSFHFYQFHYFPIRHKFKMVLTLFFSILIWWNSDNLDTCTASTKATVFSITISLYICVLLDGDSLRELGKRRSLELITSTRLKIVWQWRSFERQVFTTRCM